MNNERTRALIHKVASLNPDAGEIGPGMLKTIVHEARVSVAQSRTNLEHVKAQLTFSDTVEDEAEVSERRRDGRWYVNHAAYSEAVRICAG